MSDSENEDPNICSLCKSSNDGDLNVCDRCDRYICEVCTAYDYKETIYCTRCDILSDKVGCEVCNIKLPEEIAQYIWERKSDNKYYCEIHSNLLKK